MKDFSIFFGFYLVDVSATKPIFIRGKLFNLVPLVVISWSAYWSSSSKSENISDFSVNQQSQPTHNKTDRKKSKGIKSELFDR